MCFNRIHMDDHEFEDGTRTEADRREADLAQEYARGLARVLRLAADMAVTGVITLMGVMAGLRLEEVPDDHQPEDGEGKGPRDPTMEG